MSIKIYDAFKFDKKYSIFELRQMFEPLVPVIDERIKNIMRSRIAAQMAFYQDFYNIFGEEKTNEMLRKAEEKANVKGCKSSERIMPSIWKAVLAHNTQSLKYYVQSYFMDKIAEDCKSPLRADSAYDFNCSVTILPAEDKLLLMYFGSYDLKNIVTSISCLSDYHYQNQCDKPDNVSDEEWNQRAKDWESVIGPNYRPCDHGFTFTLFDGAKFTINLLYVNPTGEDIPDTRVRATQIVDYMDDYPNPPSGPYGIEWIRYLRSADFCEWKEKRLNEICEKLENIPVNI